MTDLPEATVIDPGTPDPSEEIVAAIAGVDAAETFEELKAATAALAAVQQGMIP